MQIEKLKIANFRLLADVELNLESQTTVVVGRNNSGKTSLSEVMRRFLAAPDAAFQIEDFSSSSYDGFCAALKARNEGRPDSAVRELIPRIEVGIFLRYRATEPLGPLSEFVVDLDPDCTEALAVCRYELRDGAIAELFRDQPTGELTAGTRPEFFRALRERIPKLFTARVWAQDPNDEANRREMPRTALRSLVATGFISAQRGMDDTTSKDTDVLARILERLFTTATSPNAAAGDRGTAEALRDAVRGIQTQIDGNFSAELRKLMPALEKFGYPGLGGQRLETETTLDVERLLSDHTKVRYAGYEGVRLPESYNGLGVRNLIFILLQLVRLCRSFRAEADPQGVHLIFIEEPEAHLHPQMQEVFIRQLSKLADQLNSGRTDETPWPVQFVVSTHSSHIANAAGFEAIRYFLPATAEGDSGVRRTKIKDLRKGLSGTPGNDAEFLHQYLTLTRCDLFFADKAALIEGTSERLLLPAIIKKLEDAEPDAPKLSIQYVTVMEVGGAYANIFFPLLEFLELRCLIITDLDPVSGTGGRTCVASAGDATSNACLRAWFGSGDHSIPGLLAKSDADKVRDRLRVAFQVPETVGGPCGRTLEDALMLANRDLFGIAGVTPLDQEKSAWERVAKIKKSEFALKYAIRDTAWVAPGYILDGLRWLARDAAPAPGPGVEPGGGATALAAGGGGR